MIMIHLLSREERGWGTKTALQKAVYLQETVSKSGALVCHEDGCLLTYAKHPCKDKK
jgi:hypothetical protein